MVYKYRLQILKYQIYLKLNYCFLEPKELLKLSTKEISSKCDKLQKKKKNT